jgi:hypothetical protein
MANTLLVVYFVLIGHVIVDCLFFSTATIIVAHLKILQNRILNFEYNRKSAIEEFIQYHLDIIECCELLNKIFADILLFQLIVSATNFCMIAVQLVMVGIFLKI